MVLKKEINGVILKKFKILSAFRFGLNKFQTLLCFDFGVNFNNVTLEEVFFTNRE